MAGGAAMAGGEALAGPTAVTEGSTATAGGDTMRAFNLVREKARSKGRDGYVAEGIGSGRALNTLLCEREQRPWVDGALRIHIAAARARIRTKGRELDVCCTRTHEDAVRRCGAVGCLMLMETSWRQSTNHLRRALRPPASPHGTPSRKGRKLGVKEYALRTCYTRAVFPNVVAGISRMNGVWGQRPGQI